MRRITLFIICAVVGAAIAGCGYSNRSMLPANYKNIYVDNFKNAIKVDAEQSNVRMYRGYKPGLEFDVTRAVISKFLSDGTLKIAHQEDADLLLTGILTDFRREPLRYDANNNIEEYRIKLIVDLELDDPKTGVTVWTEKGFAGETTYRLTGSLAQSEDSALRNAVEDLARRVMERTVEAW